MNIAIDCQDCKLKKEKRNKDKETLVLLVYISFFLLSELA